MHLPLAIAAGIIPAELESSQGNVTVPDERNGLVARIQANAGSTPGIPLGAVEWQQPYDPADHAPYAFDFSPLLDEGDRVAEILSVRLSSSAAALGIQIDQADGYQPLIDQAAGLKAQLWFVVADGQQEAASFLGAGVKIPVTMRVRTTLAPIKKFERTMVLTVRQL